MAHMLTTNVFTQRNLRKHGTIFCPKNHGNQTKCKHKNRRRNNVNVEYFINTISAVRTPHQILLKFIVVLFVNKNYQNITYHLKHIHFF